MGDWVAPQSILTSSAFTSLGLGLVVYWSFVSPLVFALSSDVVYLVVRSRSASVWSSRVALFSALINVSSRLVLVLVVHFSC